MPGAAPYLMTNAYATITAGYTLALTISNPNQGSVEVEPNEPTYAPGTIVTLTATPAEGKQFKRWQIYDPNHPGNANYAAVDANNPIVIVMDTDREVKAIFKCGGGGVLPPMAAVLLTLTLGLVVRHGR